MADYCAVLLKPIRVTPLSSGAEISCSANLSEEAFGLLDIARSGDTLGDVDRLLEVAPGLGWAAPRESKFAEVQECPCAKARYIVPRSV